MKLSVDKEQSSEVTTASAESPREAIAHVNRRGQSPYTMFLEAREQETPPAGIQAHEVSSNLFPHQRAIVMWALSRGRSAVFADTGLGKTLIQLEWAHHVAKESGRVLVLTPLAVAAQTVSEGDRFGIPCAYSREDDGHKITVTNYEHLHKFDPNAFAGIVLDESSILKNYSGAFRNQIIDAFRDTPFRLACTATPAPNDHIELGNHAEFLGVQSRVEMLAEYFVHDGGSTQNWRLKGHASDPFWEWVSSWAIMMRMPSDLGFDDDRYMLPPLRMHEHTIPVEHRDTWSEGYLLAPEALSLNEQRAIRRATIKQRAAIVADIASEDGGPCLVWCELNDEADTIVSMIPGAVQVSGSDDIETKIDRLIGFAAGRYRVLVTKPKIAGFGMNWQHCSRVVFAGASHSYEQTYQAIRRCWRFGQTRPVDVHVVYSDRETSVIDNFRRKERQAKEMQESMMAHMRQFSSRIHGQARVGRWNRYEPKRTMVLPDWLRKVTR